MRAVWDCPGGFITQCALKLTALTWLRSSELRFGTWNEISWEDGLWVVPAGRMKRKRKHIVPLATQSLATLKLLRSFTGHKGDLMFPAQGRTGPVMSENTMEAAMKSLG
ncbi:phage integrase family protein [Salipiger mucosus DSM 16094]|uniref:Phage integrase family protein n=1 Tax=Salipiger mucosus DSM 16094 TaxID=1123237 RepID=S9RKL8_9RHOB|nr:phage integrase family protein [Salipiger mucosus DSM 16094]